MLLHFSFCCILFFNSGFFFCVVVIIFFFNQCTVVPPPSTLQRNGISRYYQPSISFDGIINRNFNHWGYFVGVVCYYRWGILSCRNVVG